MVLCKEKRAARREIVYRNIIHYFILYTVSARVQEILWKLSDFNGLTIFGVFDLQGRPGQGQFFCRGDTVLLTDVTHDKRPCRRGGRAGAVLKPSGGNCAVLPKEKLSTAVPPNAGRR